MKGKYIYMVMLIQEPKYPRNDIHIYVQLLKEALGILCADEGSIYGMPI
jgi:hypothetical protein